jgi:dipeptidyl aminopeptidase/acylaminoacyl peptidase
MLAGIGAGGGEPLPMRVERVGVATRLVSVWIAVLLAVGAAAALGRDDGGVRRERAVAGGSLLITPPRITLPNDTLPTVPTSLTVPSLPPITLPKVTVPKVTIPPPVQQLVDQVAGVAGDPQHVDRTGVWLVDADRGTARVLLQDLFTSSVSFSPDGTRAAAVTYPNKSMNGADPRTLWVVDLATGLRRSIVPVEPGIGSLSWSTDGRWIAYNRVPMGGGPYDDDPTAPPGPHGISEVWVVRPDGSNRHRVAVLDGWGGRLAWSADGRRLAASLYNDDRVMVADIAAGTEHRIPAVDPYLADWSPDGAELVTASDKGDTSLLDPSTGAAHVLVANAWFPRWSPRGDWIAVFRRDRFATQLVHPNGALGPVAGGGQPVDWSSDGRLVDLVLGTHAADVLDADTGTARTVAQSAGDGPELIPTVWVPRSHTLAVIASPFSAWYSP